VGKRGKGGERRCLTVGEKAKRSAPNAGGNTFRGRGTSNVSTEGGEKVDRTENERKNVSGGGGGEGLGKVLS